MWNFLVCFFVFVSFWGLFFFFNLLLLVNICFFGLGKEGEGWWMDFLSWFFICLFLLVFEIFLSVLEVCVSGKLLVVVSLKEVLNCGVWELFLFSVIFCEFLGFWDWSLSIVNCVSLNFVFFVVLLILSIVDIFSLSSMFFELVLFCLVKIKENFVSFENMILLKFGNDEMSLGFFGMGIFVMVGVEKVFFMFFMWFFVEKVGVDVDWYMFGGEFILGLCLDFLFMGMLEIFWGDLDVLLVSFVGFVFMFFKFL